MKKFFELRRLLKSYGVKIVFNAALAEIYRKIWLEFINNSYSQNGEDKIIEKLFDKDYVGKYLEIGAYHPKRLSNTYRFYKKGWRGVVIEPNPNIKKLFIRFRPQDIFMNVGISDKSQVLNYYQFLIPALNTFSQVEADKNIKQGHMLKNILKIKTKGIKEIVNNKIDFLSIDTEGFDEMILKNWDWKKYQPRVICVESDKKNMIKNFLKKNGYKLKFRTKYNSIFELIK